AYYMPNPVNGPSYWFWPTTSGDIFDCEPFEHCQVGAGFTPAPPRWDSLDLRLATGNVPFEYFEHPMNWAGRLHLYRRLHDAVILLPSAIDSFLNDSET